MEIKLTNELKAKIVSDVSEGLSIEECARKYGTSKIQMQRWIGKMKLALKIPQPEGTVKCDAVVKRNCYYGDPQGTYCNYMEIEGHSRIIEEVKPNGEVNYHNLCNECKCFVKAKPRGLRGIVL